MSVRLHHGYRIPVETSVPEFCRCQVRPAMDPIRDTLDATVFAELLALTFDERHRVGATDTASLIAETRAKFTAFVTAGRPGEVWHDPHSFALNIQVTPTDPGYRYVLLECQRDAYRDAWEALPGVALHDYFTSTDTWRDRGFTREEWASRGRDWAWLLEAPGLDDVTTRWDLRPDGTPNWTHVTDPEVILAHLPTKVARAQDRARDQAAADHFGDRLATLMQPGGLTLGELGDFFTESPRVVELAEQYAAALPDITVEDLTA